MRIFRRAARPLSAAFMLAAGLLGSTAALAQVPPGSGITVQFQLLSLTPAAVPVGNGVVIGTLLGIVAAVFLFRRRAMAAVPAIVLSGVVGGLLGGTAPGEATTSMIVGSKVDDFFQKAAGAVDKFLADYGSPEEGLAAIPGRTLSFQVACPDLSQPQPDAIVLTNQFGVQRERPGFASFSLFPQAYASTLPGGPLPQFQVRIVSVTENCAEVRASKAGQACAAGTTLNPGDSCTIGDIVEL